MQLDILCNLLILR